MCGGTIFNKIRRHCRVSNLQKYFKKVFSSNFTQSRFLLVFNHIYHCFQIEKNIPNTTVLFNIFLFQIRTTNSEF